MLSQGLIPATAEIDAAQAGTAAAVPVQPPPDLECPAWCASGHDTDHNGPSYWARDHCRTSQYIDLQGHSGGFAMVTVCAHDTWNPTVPTAWKREGPMVMITPIERGAGSITIWNVPTLRPILKAGPLLMPGLLDLIVEAVQFCGIKIPAEYAR
jgi:hypothetical protein